MMSLRGHLRNALRRQKVSSISKRLTSTFADLDLSLKEILGYNMAALKYVRRQYEANTTAEFYEQDPLLDEAQVRQMIEDGKKRKRKVVL